MLRNAAHMVDWLEWADLVLGAIGAIGTGGILVLLHQWYVDNHKPWPYRLRDLHAIGGTPDGKSGVIGIWIDNPTNRNAYFSVWAYLSNGERFFPKRVDASPSGLSNQITVPIPPHEEAAIYAIFEEVPQSLDVVRVAISEGRRPQLERYRPVSLYLNDVRAGQGLPKWDPKTEAWPVAGWHYYKDIRYRQSGK